MAENEVIKINNEVSKPGPKGKYETHVKPYLPEIFEWLKQGYTDCSICEQLGLHQNTWIRYREENIELSKLYARARAHRNALVMNKMYEKATGYEHKDLFIAQYQGEIVEKEIIKHYPPCDKAADLFLRNNDPDYKSAKASNDIGNLTINNIQLPQLEDELKQIEEQRKTLEMQLGSDYTVINDDTD